MQEGLKNVAKTGIQWKKYFRLGKNFKNAHTYLMQVTAFYQKVKLGISHGFATVARTVVFEDKKH